MSSWEDQALPTGSVVDKITSLDINAPEFIPGQPYLYKPVNLVISTDVPPNEALDFSKETMQKEGIYSTS